MLFWSCKNAVDPFPRTATSAITAALIHPFPRSVAVTGIHPGAASGASHP